MIAGKSSEVPEKKMDMEGVKGVSMRWLVDKEKGAPNFAMRLFEIEPHGHTPFHSHEWEHINYFVEGEVILRIEEEERACIPGDYSFVPPNKKHQFRNESDKPAKFLCLIPNVD